MKIVSDAQVFHVPRRCVWKAQGGTHKIVRLCENPPVRGIDKICIAQNWSATYCTSTVCTRDIAGVSSVWWYKKHNMQWPQTRISFAILQREQYFAVSEITLRGRCACNGHASSATVVEDSCSCVCQHGTAGQYCEECAAGSQFSLWRRALPDCPFVCQSEYLGGCAHNGTLH